MMERKWSPGPWCVGRNTPHRVYQPNGQIIAECDKDHVGLPIFEANARLIAAAPDMYEALKGLVRYAEAARHTAGMGKTQAARLEAAKAALAKAEGRE